MAKAAVAKKPAAKKSLVPTPENIKKLSDRWEKNKARVDKRVDKERPGLDPIYTELAVKVGGEWLRNSRYAAWMLAQDMNVDEAKLAMRLPDPYRDPEWGKEHLEVSEKLAKEVGLDTKTANKYLQHLFEIDFLSPTRKGYQVPKGSHWWNHNGMRSKKNRYKMESPDVNDAAWIYGRMSEYNAEREKLVDEAKSAGKKLIGWFIVPRWKAVKDIPGLLPQEDMRQILRAHKRFCLVDCVCQQDDRESDCGILLEKCLTFDRGADYRIDERKDGRELTIKEAFDFIDELGKYPIISAPMSAMVENVKDINSICNCHWDCCLAMTQWYMPGSKHKANEFLMKTRFRATVDPEKCIGCRTCVDGFCQFYAAKMKYYPEFGGERAYIDEAECIGCGLCVENCPAGARGMKVIAGPEYYLDISRTDGAGGGGLNVEKLLKIVETEAEKKK